MSSAHAAASSTETLTDPGPSQQQQQPQQGPVQDPPSLPQEPQQEDSEPGPHAHDLEISDPNDPARASTSAQANGHGGAEGKESEVGELPGTGAGTDGQGPSVGNGHAEAEVAEHEHAGMVDDSQQWTEEESHELKRVKVYELIGSRWVDQGTAFCFGDFQDNEAFLIARAEADFNHVILSTTIRSNDVYQRQQDTLIVWTEPDGIDYALSFQDPEGCGEVWNFIQDVQRHMSTGEDMLISSSPILSPEPSFTANLLNRTGRLPPPQMGIMNDVKEAIRSLIRSPHLKERMCEWIQAEKYIEGMIEVMHQAEDLENLENLHALCGCMQAILLLNDHALYQYILDDDLFFGVVGMLEYDPEFPTHKANYREFLQQMSHFHQPVPIRDEVIQRKIHHTYRLQFLKDVVLARAIDDSTFNVLNSCILFNQIDIINHIQNDQAFLREIVGMYMDEDLLVALGLSMKGKEPEKEKDSQKDADKMDVDASQSGPQPPQSNGSIELAPNPSTLSPQEIARRREVIFLIQQLCVMGKNVQVNARLILFRNLVDRGILFAVQWALSQPENEVEGLQMIAASGEIFSTLLDHDLNGVRGHVLKQLGAMEREKASGKKIVEKETVLALMCRVLVRSRDLAVQSQVGESLKTMLEIVQDQEPHSTPMGVKSLQRARDDPGVEKFLDYFYKSCVETLFKPFGDIPEFKTRIEPTLTLSRERTNLYLYLCDLLANFTQQHSFRSHFFILSSNISPRVASLLSARDKHLRLAAFRFFRSCLKLNNGNLFKHMFKHDVFGPILDLTIQESRRDNLISSACQEFFEHIRHKNMKELIHHCMTQHPTKIRTLAESRLGGPRFTAIIKLWERNMEPPPPPESEVEKPPPAGLRRWGQGRLLDAEEENYFNSADDDEDPPLPIVSTPPPRGSLNTLKRKRARGTGIPVRALRSPYLNTPPTAPLGGLVDYDDGDDAGGPVPATDGATPVSPKVAPRSPRQQPGHFPYASNSAEVPGSPRIAHRQIPASKTPTMGTSPPSPSMKEDLSVEALWEEQASKELLEPGLGAKRRRDEDDDDDELLERLANKAKRPSVVASIKPDKENGDMPIVGKAAPVKTEEGPKKIKLKFGTVGATIATSSPTTPATSCTGTKDGDNG